jgi:biotin transporter BioY
MKKLTIYLKGGLIGMISEYCFRVEFGYLQGFILSALVIGMIIDVIQNW